MKNVKDDTHRPVVTPFRYQKDKEEQVPILLSSRITHTIHRPALNGPLRKADITMEGNAQTCTTVNRITIYTAEELFKQRKRHETIGCREGSLRQLGPGTKGLLRRVMVKTRTSTLENPLTNCASYVKLEKGGGGEAGTTKGGPMIAHMGSIDYCFCIFFYKMNL